MYFLYLFLISLTQSIIYNNCDESTQTIDTYKICKIFQSLDLSTVFPAWNLSSSNYCNTNTNGLTIYCSIPPSISEFTIAGSNILTSVSGSLNFTDELGWPSSLEILSLYEQEIRGNFDFNSLSNLTNLQIIDLYGVFTANPKTISFIFEHNWNTITNLPNLYHFDIANRDITTDLGYIKQWKGPMQYINVCFLYFFILETLIYINIYICSCNQY